MRRGDKDNGFFGEFCSSAFKYKPRKGDIEVRTNTELFLLFFFFSFSCFVDCSGFSFHPLIHFAILTKLGSFGLFRLIQYFLSIELSFNLY